MSGIGCILAIIIFAVISLMVCKPEELRVITNSFNDFIKKNESILLVAIMLLCAFLFYHLILGVFFLLGEINNIWSYCLFILCAYPCYKLINKCIDFFVFETGDNSVNITGGVIMTIYFVYEMIQITDKSYWFGYEWNLLHIIVAIIIAIVSVYVMYRFIIKQFKVNEFINKLYVFVSIILIGLFIIKFNKVL